MDETVLKLFLKRASGLHEREHKNYQLAAQSGITPEAYGAIWVQEAAKKESFGYAAEQVLQHSPAFHELMRLLENNWFYLEWVPGDADVPDEEIDDMAAFQTADYTPPYPFIEDDPYPFLKRDFREPEYFETYHVDRIDVIIEEVLGLRFLDEVSQDLAWETALVLMHVRAYEQAMS